MSELEHIRELLSKPLSDDPLILSEAVREIEAHYSRATHLLAMARHELSKAMMRELKPKTKEISEAERAIVLAAAVAHEKFSVDDIEGIVKAISQRVIFSQSLLKAYAQEASHLQA